MIINIASFGGRTHMLDTARELEKFGHTVRFYSFVRDNRAMKSGLKKECNFSIFWFAVPFLILKVFKYGGWQRLYNYCCDKFIAHYMKPCDVFIGQSPMHSYAIKYAKKKYNAITILERGVSHVLYQVQVLSHTTSTRKKMSKHSIQRDLDGYNYPDYISVGSQHVLETFVSNGYPKEKIFVNNYGVNLDFFHPTLLRQKDVYDILFVGQWSYRKGCDLIVEAVRRKSYKFLHVGSIVDLRFPESEKNLFTHIDAVPEYKLVEYYARARVFVIPSRDEGLALVQPQALACGLPLVCSDRSGGKDLSKATKDGMYIYEMEEYNVDCLISCIEQALKMSKLQEGKIRNIMSDNNYLSLESYGKRYNDFLLRLKNSKKNI